MAPALLGRKGKARWYGARPVHEEETLAPTACVAERGVLFWSEPCRRVPARGDMVCPEEELVRHACIRHTQNTVYPEHNLYMPARGDMVRAMPGDSWPRNVDAILHVLIGVPETDEMPVRRVCGDVPAARHAPPPPLPGAQTAAICLSLASRWRQQILTVPAGHLLRHYGYCCCCCCCCYHYS